MPSVLRTNAPDDQQRIADALAGLAAGGEQNQAAADAMVPPPQPGPRPPYQPPPVPSEFAPMPANPALPAWAPGAVQAVAPHLADRATLFGPQQPPSLDDLGGKISEVVSDPRVQGLLTDAASVLGLAIPGPGGAAAAAKVAVPVGKSILATIMSRTADPRALERAMGMAAEGQTPQRIWNAARQRGEQRWFQGPDEQWVHEIPGVGSQMRKGGPTDYALHPLSEHLDYPALYDAFPQIAKLATRRMSPEYAKWLNEAGGATAGGYMPWSPGKPPFIIYDPAQTVVKSRVYPGQLAGSREILLHEGGHGVAQLTGLPSGGTNAALQGESRAAARDRYLRSAGENAAGADQKRMDMTLNELAAKPWWKSLDYPAEQQLFTYSPMIRRK